MRPLQILLAAFSLMLATGACADSKSAPQKQEKAMTQKLLIEVGGKTLTATMFDSAATKDLLAQLPLTLTLNDFNGTEKIANPPKKLSTSGAPDGFDPVAGDIAYYAPWGNLAIFYRDFRYSRNLIRLGKIDGDGIKSLRVSGDVKVTIRIQSTEGK